jgi:hypothetical protein
MALFIVPHMDRSDEEGRTPNYALISPSSRSSRLALIFLGTQVSGILNTVGKSV